VGPDREDRRLFIPIHDDNPHRHITAPVVVYAVVGLTLAAFLMTLAAAPEAVERALLAFGLVPAVLTGSATLAPGLEIVPAWATLLTYAFLHAGWMHLLGNMAFVWVFADNIEDALGHARFAVFYLACAAAAGLAHVLVDPASQAPMIGASGAVAGVVGAYLVLHPHVRAWVLVLGPIPIRLPAAWLILAWAAFQVWNAVTDTEGAVAWWSHVGGFLAGAALVVPMRRRGVALFDRPGSK
jgi:membrane associated rhomboid family serine protease